MIASELNYKLDAGNFLLFAMHNYDNPQCATIDEFVLDLKRFNSLLRMFNQYERGKDLRARMILNHLVTLYNLFGVGCTNMLFYKLPREHWALLATFLTYIDRMPESLPQYGMEASNLEILQSVNDELDAL